MSAYLKTDTAFPSGLDYLNINKISLPPSILNLGGLVSGFKFAAGLGDIVGSSSTVVGIPTKDVDGYFLGNAGFIDTGLKETDEFTWIALFRVAVGNVKSPLISSFVSKELSVTGYANGNNLARQDTQLKMSDTADSPTVFTAGGLTTGKWALLAVSKKNETGGYRYRLGKRAEGGSNSVSASLIGTASKNTEQNIQIGWTSKGGTAITNSSQLINFASIHDKGLTAAELTTLMDNLVVDLATQGIVL